MWLNYRTPAHEKADAVREPAQWWVLAVILVFFVVVITVSMWVSSFN